MKKKGTDCPLQVGRAFMHLCPSRGRGGGGAYRALFCEMFTIHRMMLRKKSFSSSWSVEITLAKIVTVIRIMDSPHANKFQGYIAC